MKRVLKWVAGLVCTIAILGAIVFSPLGHVGPKAPVANLIGPRAPVANLIGLRALEERTMQQSNFQPETVGGPRIPDNFIGPRVPTNPLDFGTVQKGSSKTLDEMLTNPNNGTLIWNVSITYGTG